MKVAAGSHIGPYDILLPLGAGGFGEVYKARDTRLDRVPVRGSVRRITREVLQK
jgi:serine/threonine protein kinase